MKASEKEITDWVARFYWRQKTTTIQLTFIQTSGIVEKNRTKTNENPADAYVVSKTQPFRLKNKQNWRSVEFFMGYFKWFKMMIEARQNYGAKSYRSTKKYYTVERNEMEQNGEKTLIFAPSKHSSQPLINFFCFVEFSAHIFVCLLFFSSKPSIHQSQPFA